jgi:hypothetical protein
VAAYLAAHGLAGAAVEAAGYVEGGPYPVSMTLESSDAVDDIRCELSDETRLFTQAKRECGLDDQFRLCQVATESGGQTDVRQLIGKAA